MRALTAIALALVFASCAHGPAGFYRNSDYTRFLDSRLEEKKLYSDGRALLHVKAMPADAALVAEQEKLFPGQALKLDAGRTHYIVAMTVVGRDPFSSAQLKFRLDGVDSVSVREIADQTVIENHYPFAYPFHRVFVVSFAAGAPGSTLAVLAPVGPVEIKFMKGEA